VIFDAESIKIFFLDQFITWISSWFPVGVLSGQRVLDYTRAHSSIQLCCTLSYS